MTTAGRPWPSAVASTPDESIFRYGKTQSVLRSMSGAISSSPMNRSCHSTRSPQAELVDRPARLRHRRRLGRVAGDDQAHLGDALGDRGQRAHEHVEPLVGADEPEEEQRRALRRPRGRAREDRVRDPHEPVARDAVRRELLDRAIRLDDDAADRRERLAPGAHVALLARQHVVRGEHGRVAPSDAVQPVHVVARDREPLHVDDVGAQRAHAVSSRRTLGPYSSPFSTTRARLRGARRSSRDESGRNTSSRR